MRTITILASGKEDKSQFYSSIVT